MVFSEWVYLLMGFLLGGLLGAWGLWERKRLWGIIEGLNGELDRKKTELAHLLERLTQLEEYRGKLETEKRDLLERLEELKERLSLKEVELARLKERVLQEEKLFNEKLSFMEKAQEELKNTFKALSAEILEKTGENFLKVARRELEGRLKAQEEAVFGLTQPISEALEKINREIREMEAKREGAYKGLEEGIRNLIEVYLPRLQRETENLSRALRHPRIRGRWGEIQLRRIVEMVGMLPRCDFEEQVSFSGSSKNRRPDLIVRLPGGRTIAIDAKVPLEILLEAVEEADEEKSRQKLEHYVAGLRNHIKVLSQRQYWEAIESRWQRSPEFVILFLPAEGLLSAALRIDPGIIEFGVEHRVLLATPVTLLAVLKAVAYAWQEQEMADGAREIVHLGKELYDRLRILSDHFNHLGHRLKQTVEAYNRTLCSYENRILVTARKFEDLRLISPEKRIPEVSEISPTLGAK
ncbi:DNA recombination protein RmuC [Thermosulfuriphilus sp.]